MNDKRIPDFGLGTFRLTGQTVVDSVRNAIDLGYRAIDTAQIYGNEAEVGLAISEAGAPRERLFLTTKIWTENLGSDRLVASLRESLARLRTDHVDLTLIHWPSPGGAVPLAETLEALVSAKAQGLTRLIGVSNFPIALMQQAIALVGSDEIATNQVELHPHLQNRDLAAFAKRHGIRVTSYMTLGYGQALKDPVIAGIAGRLNVTPAQVTLAWAMQRGFAVIPSSTRRVNLESNLRATSLRLDDADLARIDALDRGARLVDPEGLAPRWDA